jgi:hypothetical protein
VVEETREEVKFEGEKRKSFLWPAAINNPVAYPEIAGLQYYSEVNALLVKK